MSKMAEMKYIIHQLWDMNVQRGPNGQYLQEMDYRSLVSLLAVQRAAAE